MDYVINAIDYRHIMSLANQHADFQYEIGKELNPDSSIEYSNFEPKMSNDLQSSFLLQNTNNVNFITIGSLSPEKDHMYLFLSFCDLSERLSAIMFYILVD